MRFRWGLMLAVALSACSDLSYDDTDAGVVGAMSGTGGDGSGNGGSSARGGNGGSAPGGNGGSISGSGGAVSGNGGSGPIDAGPDAPPAIDGSTGEPCTTEAALRCTAAGGSARELCENGFWVATDACADGEICNRSADVAAGTCSTLFELCSGHANEPVCVGADMHFCDADGVSTRFESCGSERLCQQGLPAGACPACLIDAYHCEGRQLQRCKADGTGYMDAMLCDTPELCNATSGACTASACLPGDKTCSGNELLQCKTDQSGYEHSADCMAGLCDMVGKQCDVCVPAAKICNASANGVRECTTNGQGYTDSACEATKSHCIGNGTCVECSAPAHCTTAGRTNCVSNVCRPCASPCPVGNNCSLASDCATSICTSGKCRPACSGSCALGAACVAANDCASNECTAGKCSKTCGAVTLTTQGDYDANKDCTRINGNLTISWNTTVVNPEFANLTAVTGTVGVTYSGGNFNPTTGIRLPVLQTIGGDVVITGTRITTVNWPQLTSIGGQLASLQMPEMTSFETIRLTSIGGAVQFTFCPVLTRLDMRALRTSGEYYNIVSNPKLNTTRFDAIQDVVGAVNLQDLMFLNYNSVKTFWEAGNRSEPPSFIGCCIAGAGIAQFGCEDINIFSPVCMQ
jgi:hypothetical protein